MVNFENFDQIVSRKKCKNFENRHSKLHAMMAQLEDYLIQWVAFIAPLLLTIQIDLNFYIWIYKSTKLIRKYCYYYYFKIFCTQSN